MGGNQISCWKIWSGFRRILGSNGQGCWRLCDKRQWKEVAFLKSGKIVRKAVGGKCHCVSSLPRVEGTRTISVLSVHLIILYLADR